MSRARTISLEFALLALPTGLAAADLPAWMAGCWIEEKGDRWTEECWTDPRAGLMLGSGRSGTGQKLGDWEVMQIVLSDPATGAKMTFWGAPRGQGRTAFSWVPDQKPGVTFANVAHNFPQRIRYWREGGRLHAEISLLDGSRATHWSYAPMGG